MALGRTEWLDWLRAVSKDKHLSLRDETERDVAARMLSWGLVQHYYDEDGEWFDVHPALDDFLRQDGERATTTAANPAPKTTTPQPPEPHAVARVALKNMGPFESLELELRPGWNILVGNNGCGKTSVIRTLALALAGNDPGAAVAAQRLLRAGADDGLVRVETDHDVYITSLSRVRGTVRTVGASETLPQQGRWLVLGFPALRGITARVIAGPTVVAPPTPGAYDLLPLIEGAADARLDDTRQWIVNTALRAEGNEGEAVRRRYQQLLGRWFEILRELMPGLDFSYERVDRDTWQVLVRTPDGTIPLDQLSQGMVSTMGWIGTLLRRLYEAYPESRDPELEPALVLIDEIDAHLHPSWQRRIVPLVRSRFPRVQVVATSHSPLVVANLAPEEIVVFRRDDRGRIAWLRVEESLRGYRADQVLTSEAFGLETTRTEYATKLLQDYADALSTNAPDLDALTERVRKEIPSPPETIKERLALDDATRETDALVRESLAANPDDLGRLEAILQSHRPRWRLLVRRVEVDIHASPPHKSLAAADWKRWEARSNKATREVRDWIDAITAPPPAAGAVTVPAPGAPPELREAIWGDLKDLILDAVFRGRCAFCEVTETVGGFGDGEHYRPKRGVDGLDKSGAKFRPFEVGKAKYAGYLWLAYDWLNLVPACSKCNTYKANHFWVKNTHCLVPAKGNETTVELNASEKPLLLHPYFDSPRAHLRFGEAGVISARGQSERGAATIQICKLDRVDLTAARASAQRDAWNRVKVLVLEAKRTVPEAIEHLFNECNAGAEPFSAAVMDFLALKLNEHIEATRKNLAASEALDKKMEPIDP